MTRKDGQLISMGKVESFPLWIKDCLYSDEWKIMRKKFEFQMILRWRPNRTGANSIKTNLQMCPNQRKNALIKKVWSLNIRTFQLKTIVVCCCKLIIQVILWVIFWTIKQINRSISTVTHFCSTHSQVEECGSALSVSSLCDVMSQKKSQYYL